MWCLDRITSRTLPITKPYCPVYTGSMTSVYVPHNACSDILGIVRAASPEINIITYTSLANVSHSHDTALCSVLVLDHAELQSIPKEQFYEKNLLVVLPAGDQQTDIDLYYEFDKSYYLVVGNLTQADTIPRVSNTGNIDLYAPGADSAQSAAIVASCASHFVNTNLSDNILDLKQHITTSATTSSITGVWFPYDKEILHLHDKHKNNRILHVPTSTEPMLWNMSVDFDLRFFINKFRPKTIKLRVHESVRRITTDIVDLPHFVQLLTDTLVIDTRTDWQTIQPGIYQFVLTAHTATAKQSRTFEAVVMDFDDREIDYGVKYIRVNNEYLELMPATLSGAADFD
jgi:hypothetical protein